MEQIRELQLLRRLMRELELLDNLDKTLAWDMRVVMPAKGAARRAEQLEYLARLRYGILTGDEMEQALQTAAESELSPLERRMTQVAAKERASLMRIPRREYENYAALNLTSEVVWQEARKNNDYGMLMPYLKRQFAYKKMVGGLLGDGDVMTGLMGEYEQGLTVDAVDAVFEKIKAFAVPFAREARRRKGPDRRRIEGFYPKKAQREWNLRMIETIGYDLQAGRLDESAHPYNSSCSRWDVRITTRYFERDFTSSVLSTLHEMGHALYWQNMDESLAGTYLSRAASFGFDESQSRIMENFIGRGRAFWRWAHPQAKRLFPDLPGNPESFYRNLNAVGSTPIRLEADELMYNLHIILRYELEKRLFDGTLTFEDLPEEWNRLSEQMLGVRPACDAEGVLQDMHWASGHIGYFQTYVIANCYDGHLYAKLCRDVPSLEDDIARGEFSSLTGWLRENVQRQGMLLPPQQLLREITGETLGADHYVRYLREKYEEIYQKIED